MFLRGACVHETQMQFLCSLGKLACKCDVLIEICAFHDLSHMLLLLQSSFSFRKCKLVFWSCNWEDVKGFPF